MKFPKGKGFDINSSLVITVVTNEEFVFTGTFLGELEERGDTPIFVDVDVNVETEFILLQLTCPFNVRHIPELPVGTIVAVNVAEIIFIAPISECECECDDKHHHD